MKTEIKKLGDSKIEINIEVDSSVFEEFVIKTIQKIQKNLTVQGFRKGKVPEDIVIQNVGEMNILNEAAEEVINDSYKKIIIKNKIVPLGSPEINITKIARKNPLIFKIVVSVLPEIKLYDYKKILPKIEKKEITIEDKEVEQAMDYIKRSRAKLIEKGPLTSAEKEDFVEIKYSDETNDVADKQIEDKLILGQSGTLSDFEKEIIGMKKGDKKVFKVKVSEKEEKTFNLELKDIKKVEFPELNDEFVKTIGKFKNLEEFKANIKEGIKREKEFAEKERTCFEFLEKVREKSEIVIPDILVSAEQNKMFNNFKQNIEKEMKLEDYLKKVLKTEKEILESFKAQAKIRVSNFLILRKIAEDEKIEANKEEIDKKEKEIIQYYGLKKEDIDINQIREYTEEQIIIQKTFDYIYSFYNK